MKTKLFELLPTAEKMDEEQLTLTIARAAVAHLMNGGEWKGWLGSALAYLENVK